MTHLTDRELSAHLDHALSAGERERVDAHLTGCETCRAALARLAAQDRALSSALEHDPGEAYFEAFASRVENRIRATGLVGAQTHPERFEGAWGWLRSPRALAWAGVAAGVVVGAGVVMMTGREVEMPNLHRPQWTDHVTRAPARGAAPLSERKVVKTVPEDRLETGTRVNASAPKPQGPVAPREQTARDEAAREQATRATHDLGAVAPRPAPEAAAPAQPGYAYEVRRNAAGEDVRVGTEHRLPGSSNASAPLAVAPPATGSGPVYARKDRRAEPMGLAPKLEQTRPSPPPVAVQAQKSAAPAPAASGATRETAGAAPMTAELDAREAGATTRRCGTVRDGSGRPVASAQVIVAETGESVSSGKDGSFCIDIASPGRTLIAMAVGFETDLHPLASGERGSIAMTLHAVPVVGGGLALKGGEPSPGITVGPDISNFAKLSGGRAAMSNVPRIAEPHDPFAASPDPVRNLVQTARNLEGDAARVKSASQYEAAATQWERVVRAVPVGSAEVEARFHVAAARYQAWQIEPFRERAVAALSSTSAYLLIAPPGAQREQALGWLGQLRWSTSNKSLYR